MTIYQSRIIKNVRGQPTYIRYADGLEIWYEYDELGRLVSSKTNQDFSQTREYTEEGLVITTDWGAGNPIVTRYNPNQQEVYYRGNGGAEMWHEYDEDNNLIHTKYSDGFEEWMEYNANKELVGYRDSDGQLEIYT